MQQQHMQHMIRPVWRHSVMVDCLYLIHYSESTKFISGRGTKAAGDGGFRPITRRLVVFSKPPG
jgi:hypothetical protein